MDIIIFNVFRVIGIALFTFSLLAICISFHVLAKMGENGVIKGEEIKEYEAIRFYGIVIPGIAAIVSIIIIAPIIFIELNTNL